MGRNFKVIIVYHANNTITLTCPGSNCVCPHHQVSHKNYSKAEFLEKLGESIVKVVECIPEGGVLVFLPSYALLRKCERLWNPAGSGSNRRAYWSQFEGASNAPSIFDRLRTLKHNVIMEPSGSNQTEFEEKKQEYMESVDRLGGCV
jgi:Rad3-related DNA helicase